MVSLFTGVRTERHRLRVDLVAAHSGQSDADHMHGSCCFTWMQCDATSLFTHTCHEYRYYGGVLRGPLSLHLSPGVMACCSGSNTILLVALGGIRDNLKPWSLNPREAVTGSTPVHSHAPDEVRIPFDTTSF